MTRKQQLEFLAQQQQAETNDEERAEFERLERERLQARFYEREARELARIKKAQQDAAVKKYVKRCGPVNQPPEPQPPETPC